MVDVPRCKKVNRHENMRTILERYRSFGLEVIREGDAAPLQLTTPKWGNMVRKPVLRPIAANLVMNSDILSFLSEIATWFE